MPIDKKITLEIPEAAGDDFLVAEGTHKAKVLDIEDAGYSKFQPDKQQFKFTFVLDDDQKIMDWATNSWWFGDPRPSKLYNIYKAAGLVDKQNNGPDDLNDIIGKELMLQIFHKVDKEGTKRARIKDYYAVEKER